MINEVLQDALKMQEAMKLKFTYRFGNRLKGDKESVAAHTWSMFVVADYLLEKLEQSAAGKYNLDITKVYQLIMYHDLIEAETGDEDIDPSNSKNHNAKGEKERQAMKIFPAKLPKEIENKFIGSYEEYEKRESLESKFVKIVDIIEAEFFCCNKGYLFENWTKEFHREKRLPYYEDFPELLYIQEALIENAITKYYS